MFTLPRSVRIFVATEPVDMRRGFDGLSRAVTELGMDVYSGHLFAFISKRGDRIKVLAWDHGGFMMWYKRLERGRFKLPYAPAGSTTIALDGPSLCMLLDGIDMSRVRRPRHWQPKALDRDRHRDHDVIKPSHVEGGIRKTGGQPAEDLGGFAGNRFRSP